MGKTAKVFQLLANIAIVVVCGLLCWTLITHKTINLYTLMRQPSSADHFEGITLPPLTGYRWDNHPETLVLAIREGCHFCKDSLPFYKRLSELEKNHTLHAHLLAVMPDDQKSATTELQSSGLSVDGVFNQPLNFIKVTGTPTLLLLNSSGRVKRAWVGELNSQGEQDVISAASNGNRPWYRLW